MVMIVEFIVEFMCLIIGAAVACWLTHADPGIILPAMIYAAWIGEMFVEIREMSR